MNDRGGPLYRTRHGGGRIGAVKWRQRVSTATATVGRAKSVRHCTRPGTTGLLYRRRRRYAVAIRLPAQARRSLRPCGRASALANPRPPPQPRALLYRCHKRGRTAPPSFMIFFFSFFFLALSKSMCIIISGARGRVYNIIIIFPARRIVFQTNVTFIQGDSFYGGLPISEHIFSELDFRFSHSS